MISLNILLYAYQFAFTPRITVQLALRSVSSISWSLKLFIEYYIRLACILNHISEILLSIELYKSENRNNHDIAAGGKPTL